MGARVIAAASSAEKLALARQHGADELIDYSQQSLKDAIKTLTKGQGADVIYDPVGGRLGEECLSCIAWNGRYLVIGFAAGPIPNLAANRLLLKGAAARSEEHTSELQSLMRISYAVFCLKKKQNNNSHILYIIQP